ncbi:MAG: DUF1934 domain-containing protein [Caldicoprobacterales bacterium]|nr:DUF1934 domain-containing protein [Clostridiales bacterium]
MQEGKKVILSIKGTQVNPMGEDNKIELITEGRLYKKDNAYYIEYEESTISGLEDTKTLLVVEDNRVSLERTGAHESRFVFEKGRKYVSYYETPFGSLEMGVFPTKIDFNMDETQGKVDLKYQLDISGRYAGLNELMVSYQEDAPQGLFKF